MSIGIGIKECTQRIKDSNGVILGKTELHVIKAGVSETSEVVVISKMYESLMEGLMEDLQDNQIYGEPQGRKTVIKKNCESENHGKLETALSCYLQNKASLGACAQIADMSKEDFIGYLGANGISIFQFDDEREFVEEMNNA